MRTLGVVGLLLFAVAATGHAQKGDKVVPNETPAEQRAPKGMCRIWLKDVPAAQQPAPTDCATAVKNCPPTGRVIFGDTEESKGKTKTDTTTAARDDKKSPLIKSLVDTKKGSVPPVVPRKPPPSL